MSEYDDIRDIAMGYCHTILDLDEKPEDYEFVMSRGDVDAMNEEAGRKNNPYTHMCGMKIAVEAEPGRINYARKKTDATRKPG